MYVSPIGDDSFGWYVYDFYFAYNTNKVWGYGWDCEFANQGEIEPPDRATYDTVERLKTNIPFSCIQNNPCYSMIYGINDIVSICFEDISEYDEYPDPQRIIFHFGETYSSVETKLASRHQMFAEK